MSWQLKLNKKRFYVDKIRQAGFAGLHFFKPGVLELMQPKQETFSTGLNKISFVLNNAGTAILFFLMLLTVTDVFLRKVLSKGILGTLELSEFMMVAIVFFSLAEGELLHRNVNVDLLVKKLSLKSRVIVNALVKAFGLILYCFIAVAVFNYAWLMKSSGEVSFDLLLPKYPFIYLVAVSLILFNFVLLYRTIIAFREVWRLWTR